MATLPNPSAKNYAAIPNSLVPKPEDGPRAIRTNYDFSAGGVIELEDDLQAAMTNGKLSVIQTLWVDNSANAAQVSFTIPTVGQTVVVAPNSQGFYPVMFAGYTVTAYCSGGTGVTKVAFLNVQLAYQVWQAAGAAAGFIFNGSGYLLVADPAVAALLTSVIDGAGSTVDVTLAAGSSVTVTRTNAPAMNSLADVTLAAATPAVILAADPDMFEVTVSCTAAWRVGDATTDATHGVLLAANAVYTFRTTGPVWGYSTAGGTVSASFTTY